MSDALIVIIMGSKSDLGFCRKIAEALLSFELETRLHVGSAHKTPQHLIDLLREYEADPRPKVYITVAGRSNALSGFVDGAVSAPVIACPPPSEKYMLADVFSSLRMPGGIASAVVLEPANAALLAAKILSLTNDDLHAHVRAFQNRSREQTLAADEQIRKQRDD